MKKKETKQSMLTTRFIFGAQLESKCWNCQTVLSRWQFTNFVRCSDQSNIEFLLPITCDIFLQTKLKYFLFYLDFLNLICKNKISYAVLYKETTNAFTNIGWNIP